MRLLRIVDFDEKRTLGFVYEGLSRARNIIKEMSGNNKRLYRPHTRIVKNKVDNRLRKSIHATAYWLKSYISV